MNVVANWLTVDLINAAWQIPLLAACTAGLLKILPRAEAKLQYRLWVGCLVLGIALPALSVMGPLPQLSRHRSELKSLPVQSEMEQATHENDRIMVYTAEAIPPARNERMGRFLLCLYALSLLVGTVKLLRRLKLTREVVRRSSRVTLPPSVSRSLLQAAKALHIAPVKVYSSLGICCPATVSWPGPMLIVPANFSSVPEDDAAAAISHELAHIRRRDFEVNLVYEALSLFAYFHPAIHWVKRRIAESREVLCDEIAADATMGRIAYAKSLLSLAKSVSKLETQNLLVGVLDSTPLEKRITKLIDARFPSTRLYRLLSAACCWMILAGLCMGELALSVRLPATQIADINIKPPEFDAVAVTPSEAQVGRVTVIFPHDGKGVTIKNIPLRWMIENAYNIQPLTGRLSGAPDWTKWDRYDIQARIRDSDLAVYQELDGQERWRMLQPILADRFKLTIHRETKTVPAYALVVAENGPKMKEAKPGDPAPNRATWSEKASQFPFPGKLFDTGDSHQAAGQMPMNSLARGLLGQVDGRQIVDKTGLAGTYYFLFRWTPPPQPPQASSLSLALQEYLGLKLEPTKVAVETIVIDHVERLSGSVTAGYKDSRD
jgi:uncharacterized protein (TIGR03435 family)